MSTNALAITEASFVGTGMSTMYFVRLHFIVEMYLFPLFVIPNGPAVSIESISNGFIGVVVMIMGS